MNKRHYNLLMVLVLLACAPAMAQWAEIQAGDLDPRTTARIQKKVESLYKRGDYERAHFIYSNELAHRGDKYAQYMTGYMYLMGQGVEQDPVRASAWYRIAAERRAPEFVAVRDQVIGGLNDEQRAKSDELYVELRKKYSDLVILMGLLALDAKRLNVTWTGSRLAGTSRPVMTIDPSTGGMVSADRLRSRALRATQSRLDLITSSLDIDPVDAEQLEEEFDGLWEQVREFVSVVDDDADGVYAAP